MSYQTRSTSWYRSMLVCTLCALFTLPGAAATVEIAGTGADLGTMRLLAQAFKKEHPEAALEILPSIGSSGAIAAVSAGALDLGLSSRPLKEQERRSGLLELPYAKTALVFAVASHSRASALTTAQLIDIYKGIKTTWDDGSAIRIVLRPETDNDTVLVKKYIPGMETALAHAYQRRGVPIAATDQDAADNIQSIPGGLGTISLSLILGEDRPLKALIIDGISPTAEAVENGSYPMAKTLYFIMPPQPDKWVERFIDFVFSEQGERILMQTGHVVMGKKVK